MNGFQNVLWNIYFEWLTVNHAGKMNSLFFTLTQKKDIAVERQIEYFARTELKSVNLLLSEHKVNLFSNELDSLQI